MMDPFFGGPLTGTPQWTGVPNVGFGWGMPLPAPNRQAVPGMEGFGSTVQGPTLGTQTPVGVGGVGTGIGIRPSPPAFVSPFAMPGGPGLISPDMPIELTGPALLAAVAQRRGQPQGPTSDQDVEEFIYDVLDLLPGLNEVEVRCEGGRVTLTGSVQHKKLKRDVGEICWAIPSVNDVQNNVTISPRRRARNSASSAPKQE